MSNKSTIERAFELSVDGKHRTVGEIRDTLRKEGYENVTSHLGGAATIKSLATRIKAAWSEKLAAPEP